MFLIAEDVSDKLVADIALQMTTSWKVVAPHLKFTFDDVARFDADNLQQVEKVIAMLTDWKHRYGVQATRTWLMTALQKVRRTDLSEKVRVYKDHE